MQRLYSKTPISEDRSSDLGRFRRLEIVRFRFGWEISSHFDASVSQGFSLYSRQVRRKTKTEIKAEPEVRKEKAMAKTKPVAASPVAASPAEDIGQTIGCWPFWRRSDYADIMCRLRIS